MFTLDVIEEELAQNDRTTELYEEIQDECKEDTRLEDLTIQIKKCPHCKQLITSRNLARHIRDAFL